MRRRAGSLRNLDEINRMLFVFDQYGQRSMEEDQLLRYMAKSPVLSQTVLDHKATLNFCYFWGVVTRKGTEVALLPLGVKLLGLRRAKNPNYLMNFTETQKNVIVTNAFLNPSINSPIGRTVKEFFDEDDAKRSWGYNFAESPDLPTEFMDMFGVLQQSGFLVKQGNIIEVNPAYSPLVSVLVATEADPLSAADLKESLERQEMVGLEAEKLVEKYERERLEKVECFDEAKLVTRISDWNVAAGYDIKSFSGPSMTKRHDRFIEVKGSSGREVRFFLSSNEIEKAASLREKYWLYFLPNISGGKSSEPLMIRDPYKNVLRSRKYSIKGVKFEITERSRRTKATSERPRKGI